MKCTLGRLERADKREQSRLTEKYEGELTRNLSASPLKSPGARSLPRGCIQQGERENPNEAVSSQSIAAWEGEGGREGGLAEEEEEGRSEMKRREESLENGSKWTKKNHPVSHHSEANSSKCGLEETVAPLW